MAKVMANALKMGCNNACMKRIVAAPTAGACGVLPAVLVTYYREYDVPDEKMIELARERGICLLATPHTMFTACGILYKAGLVGGA